MHILFLTDNFPPEVNAPASRTYEHCRLWVQAGHRVTVVTCTPNFPTGRVFSGWRNRLWQRETMDGIHVIRVWSFITANEGFLLRVLDYLSYMVAACVASVFIRDVDVVVGTSPQFFTACGAWVVSVFKRIPFIFELRDLWPESIKVVGALRSPRLIRYVESVELFLYRRAARIVSVTYSFRQNLGSRGIDTNKIDVVTNGVDLVRFSPRPKDGELIERLGLEGCFVAGYIGTHGMAHALETLLQAAGLIRALPGGEKIRLLFLGDGAKKAALKEESARLGLTNVIFLDSVSKDEVVTYWSILDVLVIHLRRDELFTAVIPSKLFECMGMGIPILHGVAGESAEIVKRENVGEVFEPENAAQLATLLLDLSQRPSAMATYRQHCITGSKRYDRLVLASQMLNSIVDTVSRKNA